MTSASARLMGLPMKANTIRTSATPKSQPAICTTMLDDREEKLGCRLEEDIDNDARHSERGRNPVKRQQPRANNIAADLRHRQKHIDRLSNEPQGNACSKLRPRLRRKKQPPSYARHGNRDAAHHYNEENSPADAGNRVANCI